MSDSINPYIAGSPVKGSEMFFGREDIFDFIRETLIGQHRDNVIVLYGQRRTGKTSALYQLPSRLGSRYLCVLIDLHSLALEGIDGFLWELANHIVQGLRREYQIDLPRLNRLTFMADARHFFTNTFLDQVKSAIGDRHLLLMLDEAIRLEEQVRAGKLEHEIFEYMRHLMQHYEQLNFLFSLGSGLEEMEKDYALLFNVGLYKKISFLDRKSTIALITQPIKDYYQVDPAALERIFEITSGHPFYTQTICHGLFTHWQRQQVENITIEDVNEVLDEAVERVLPQLKYVWEDSTPGEQAIIAGMATAMSEQNNPVNVDDIKRVWRASHVDMPDGDIATAIRSLIVRDVITGQDNYIFTVDLMRRWVQKYRRLDWVKEDIAETVRTWSASLQLEAPPSKSRPLSFRTLLSVGLVLVLILVGVIGVVGYNNSKQNTQHMNATVTAQALAQATANAQATVNTYPFSNNPGSPALNDPLVDNSKGVNWDTYNNSSGSCSFSGSAYHVVDTDSRYYGACAAVSSDYTNFTFEAQMLIKTGGDGAGGGLLFRADINNNKFYRFAIDTTGNYYVLVSVDATGTRDNARELTKGIATPFQTGLGTTNTLGIVARGDSYSLYINQQLVTTFRDGTYTHGQIGFDVDYGTSSTDVVFTNVKVWQL